MELKEVKQQFFALRNGLLADTLRKQASMAYKFIFGLNIIQLRELAARTGKDADLAQALWADTNCRESRLLAPMILPEPDLTWLAEVQSPEEADILCHASLRHHPEALPPAIEAARNPEPIIRYAGLRLLMNLISSPRAKQAAKALIPTLPSHPLTTSVTAQLSREI